MRKIKTDSKDRNWKIQATVFKMCHPRRILTRVHCILQFIKTRFEAPAKTALSVFHLNLYQFFGLRGDSKQSSAGVVTSVWCRIDYVMLPSNFSAQPRARPRSVPKGYMFVVVLARLNTISERKFVFILRYKNLHSAII